MGPADSPPPGSAPPADVNSGARLDRLPLTRSHYVWMIVLALNLLFDFYDNGMFAYLLPAIHENTDMTLGELGTVTSALFVGMIFGALIGGRLSDAFGRKRVLFWGTIVYSCGAVATALAPNFETMTLARIVTGVGVQATTSVLLVYVAEMFPAERRGRVTSILTGGFVVAAPLMALVVLLFIPNGGPDTWRHIFLFGAAGFLVAPMVRLLMPESPRWLESRGRTAEAAMIVDKLEAKALQRGSLPTPAVTAARTRSYTLREVFRRRRVLRTIIVVSLGYFGSTLGYYLFQNWASYALINGLGYSEPAAYRISLVWNVVYCVTPLVALLAMDKFERKTVILGSSALSAMPLLVLGLSTTKPLLLAAGGLTAVMTGVVITAFYVYIPESIPMEARGAGSGIAFAFGRVGGAVSGVFGSAMFGGWGMEGVMVTAAAAYFVFALVVLALGPRTTKRSLEGVSAEEMHAGDETRGPDGRTHAAPAVPHPHDAFTATQESAP